MVGNYTKCVLVVVMWFLEETIKYEVDNTDASLRLSSDATLKENIGLTIAMAIPPSEPVRPFWKLKKVALWFSCWLKRVSLDRMYTNARSSHLVHRTCCQKRAASTHSHPRPGHPINLCSSSLLHRSETSFSSPVNHGDPLLFWKF